MHKVKAFKNNHKRNEVVRVNGTVQQVKVRVNQKIKTKNVGCV